MYIDDILGVGLYCLDSKLLESWLIHIDDADEVYVVFKFLHLDGCMFDQLLLTRAFVLAALDCPMFSNLSREKK